MATGKGTKKGNSQGPEAQAREAFLQLIIEHPDDDSPRLVFADWLEEHGDPDRAEFIRLQCEIAQVPKHEWDPASSRLRHLRKRERDLLRHHEEEWKAEVGRGLGQTLWFGRGFIEQFAGSTWLYPRRARSIHARTPLRFVRIHGPIHSHWEPGKIDLAGLAALPALAFLETLETLGGFLPGAVAALAASPHVQRLRSLKLHGCGIGLSGVRALCSAPWMARLTELGLIGVYPSRRGSRRVGRRVAELVAGSSHLGNLRQLDLSSNRIGDAGVIALAGSPLAASLRELNLGRNAITEVGARALAESPSLRAVETLTLNDNPISEAGRQLLRERFGTKVSCQTRWPA